MLRVNSAAYPAVVVGVVLVSAARGLATDRHVPSQYAVIQAAINACANGDTVIVAQGTYTGDGNRNIDFLGKAITVRGTDPNDPNVVSRTVIDAGLVAPGFYFHSGEGRASVLAGLTIRQGFGPCGGGIFCIASSPTVVKCVIVDCKAILGGGMFNQQSSPRVSECIFRANTTLAMGGGGIANFINSSATIENCTFIANSASGSNGGGIHNSSNSNATITNCTFASNSALFGGALANVTSSPAIDGCMFIGNTGTHGGAMDSINGSNATITRCSFMGNNSHWGGAIDDWNCSATIRDCVFVGNVTTGEGGGGGALVNFGGSNLEMSNCLFSGNRAFDGQSGAIGINESNATISDCTFVGNASDSSGGAIACAVGDVTIRNCTFAGNASAASGGAIANLGATNLKIVNCSIASNNAAALGGGILSVLSDSFVRNSIVWGNAAPAGPEIGIEWMTPPFSLSVSYSDIHGGPHDIQTDPNDTLIWGTGNIDANPCFVAGPSGAWTSAGAYDPNTYQIRLTDANADWGQESLVGKLVNPDTSRPGGLQFVVVANTANTLTIWADANTVKAGVSWVASGASYQIHDYHLTINSPCISAGDPNDTYTGQVDIDGEPRVAHLLVDMGSDEFADPLPYYALDLTVVNETLGTVRVEPNLTAYPQGACIRLTAEPNQGKAFGQWDIYDSNHPGDANYAVSDPNISIQIVMDSEREITAVFRCSNGVGTLLAPLLGMLGLGVLTRRGS